MPAICKRSMSTDAKFTTCPVLMVAKVSSEATGSRKPLSTRQFAAAYPFAKRKKVHVMKCYHGIAAETYPILSHNPWANSLLVEP